MGYMDAISLGSIASPAAAGGASAFNPATAVGALAASGAASWYGNRMGQKRQHEAFDQQKYMMENRYQMQVKDLKAAGLNPMLAYASPAPMPGSVGQAQTNKPDVVGDVTQGTLASAQAAKTRQETENLKLESNNIQNTAVQILKQISKTEAEIAEIDQRAKTGKASEQELQRRTELMSIQKELVRVQASLGSQELQIKTPEQIASGTEGAAVSATISRILKPLIDMLGGAARATR